MKWMMDHQEPEGCIGSQTVGESMAGQAICALAFVEAAGMTGSFLFRDQAEKSLEFLVAAQNPGRGWERGFRDGEGDDEATGWAALALHSATWSGIRYSPGATMSLLDWAGGRAGATAAVARAFHSRSRDEATIRLLMKDLPKWEAGSIDFAAWHWGSLALFQLDGRAGANWRAWNESVKQVLLKHQRDGGSWDPVDRESRAGSRAYATAINSLTLETYYRYHEVLP